MSRMYSRAKGVAGSSKPLNPQKPVWVSYKDKEIEAIIAKLSKQGNSAAKIGLILRDSYGIPNVKLMINKRITEVLVEKKLQHQIPDDLFALIRTSVDLEKHFTANHKDMTAKRGAQLAQSKIRRLVKYYKSINKLPLDWKFDAASLRLYVQ